MAVPPPSVATLVVDSERPSIGICHASTGDASAIAALIGELGFPVSSEDIEHRLAALRDAVLVAVREGEVIGVITTHIMPVLHRPTPVGRISMLVVARAERGRGTGRLLVEAAEAMLRRRGCGLVEVTSNFTRERAHAFYKRLGFEPTSFRFGKKTPGCGEEAGG